MAVYHCPRCQKEFNRKDKSLMCSNCGFQLSVLRIQKQIDIKKFFVRMPFVVLSLIIVLALVAFFVCFNRSAVGKVCDDGSVIFYDKLHYSNGWRYLAVAPKTLSSTLWCETKNEKIKGELEREYGDGARNSYAIINRFGASTAAYKATNYGKTEDYYLGNRLEMRTLRATSYSTRFIKATSTLKDFEPLHFQQKSKNAEKLFWTSEIYSIDYAWAIDMNNKNSKLQIKHIFTEKNKLGTKVVAEKCFVRPIRKF